MAGKTGQKRRDVLIEALARGESAARAARLSGWSERTIRRRLKDPEFLQQVQEARQAMLAGATARLAGATGEAVICLRSLLTDDSSNVRLQAAKSIIEMGLRLRDHVELAAEVADIKRQLELRESPH